MTDEKPRDKRWGPFVALLAIEILIGEFVVHGLHLHGGAEAWAIVVPVLVTFVLYIKWTNGS